MTAARPPRLAVAMATYNGAAHLRAQLDSFAAQSRPPDLLLVGDDGSRDDSRAIIEAFAAAPGAPALSLEEGPRDGAAANFLALLRRVPEEIDVLALSDQDDVWLPDKLARGLKALEALEAQEGPARPLLYCGRTWECDAQLRRLRMSRLPARPPEFAHALVQNVAGGNTMMLNRAALGLVRAAGRETERVMVHDWWIYQIVTGAGGRVIYDPEPMLLYRQHGGNLIGANSGARAKLHRLRHMLLGGLRDWNTVNIRALTASAHRLTPENLALLRRFAEGRHASLPRRLAMLRGTGVYRHGLEGTLSLYAAALLGRL